MRPGRDAVEVAADPFADRLAVWCHDVSQEFLFEGGDLVVDRDYEDKAPYPFTGTVREVVFDLHPITEKDAHTLHQHAATQAVADGAAG